MPFAATPPPLNYHAMRLRWCGQALRTFVQRWGTYLAVAALAVGAGVASALTIVLAAASWLVLPLFYASAQGAWLLPAVALQALAGAGLVWGLRGVLWPLAWGDAERALPLARAQTRRSDAAVVLLALLPLWLLYTVGAATVLAHDPAWLRPTRWRAVAALLLASTATVVLGVVLLRRLRRPAVGRLAAQPGATSAPMASTQARRMRWPRALIGVPLWRGPARRTGHALALGSAALAVPGVAVWAHGASASWWIAGFAAMALTVVARVNRLSHLEFDDLFAACRHLPLQLPPLQRARTALCLLPVLPGLAGLCALLPRTEVRWPVLAAYVLACVGCCAVEAQALPADATERSSRWLLSLILCVVLATEVMV